MPESYAVIMAGGVGERFWPLSTSRHPKQLLSLFGGKPLIRSTLDRIESLIPATHVFVVTRHDMVPAIREALPEVPADQIIGEPLGRNTAPACAVGLACVKHRNPEAAFCVLTADHIIGDDELFRQTLAESLVIAGHDEALVTIGIVPTFPSTGFGYIEAGDDVEHPGKLTFQRAQRFVEKPDDPTARSYLDARRYFWNSGMFIWSVRGLENAFKQHQPELAELASRIEPHVDSAGFDAQLQTEYKNVTPISIDYAVMEKAENIVMAKGEFSWSDVGSWPALSEHFDADADDNIIIGDCETIDAAGNVVVSEGRLTALIGVRDLVVIQADGATLICPRAEAQAVKDMVTRLRESGDYEHLL